MRLLIITRAYSQTAGGLERLSFEMINALKNQPGLQIDIIHPSTEVSKNRFARFLNSIIFIATNLPRILIKARPADRVHLGDPLLSKIGWLVKLIYKKPISVHVHGTDITYPNFFYHLYLKLFFKNFDNYICISDHVQKILLTRYPKLSEKTLVLPPGFHDNFHDPSQTRSNLDQLLKTSTANKIILLTVGRLVPRKGHAWFIKNVLPHLPTNFIYVIAGTGPEQANLKNLNHPRVIFLGSTSSENLKTLYNTADAFIQPNIKIPGDTEGFGLVLLEAASCGLPVFASDIDGIGSAIHSRQNGLLLANENPTTWITNLKNFSPQKNLAARAYTLQVFSWPNLVKQYLSALTAPYK